MLKNRKRYATIKVSIKNQGVIFMIGEIENVKIISSFQHRSKPYGKIQSRKSHGFIFRIKGYAEYIVCGRMYRANEGDLIFLPKGACYEYVTSEGEDNLYTSINFEASIENPQISFYSLKDFHGANYMLQGFSQMWKFGSQADKYKCLSNFYDLLSYVARLEYSISVEKGNFSVIDPAVEYLKEHIYDTSFKVGRLHRLCGISDTYFRRMFISRFTMTPQEYVLKERLEHARVIIESGDFDSIKSVAETVGYSDPLYFSKAFRRYYGFPPSRIGE